MAKTPISITLDTDNLHWLQGQARATKARGLSETLDRLVTNARLGGRVAPEAIRSVVNTVEIGPDDPGLDEADAYVRSVYEHSIGRPFLVRDAVAPATAAPRPRRKSRRG